MTSSSIISAMPMIHENDQPLSASVHSNLTSSVPSLSSSRSQASQIAKTYRQAANLFLTRRLPEALSTIEPIITPQTEKSTNGDSRGAQDLAPIALVSKTSRIKVWVFWLTFLSAVVELGPEEGKHAFGSTKWKELVSKARDGTVWNEIVQYGYGGIAGNVDAEIVVNLATLLLAHAPSQQFNQSCLESYLSAVANPTFDVTTHLTSSLNNFRRQSNHSGANTPRDLQVSLKLLELYTLHILPRNGEWDYSREFIMMSELLDDERKEVFLQALHELKEEQQQANELQKRLQKQQEEQLKQQKQEEEEELRRKQAQKVEDENKRKEESKLQHKRSNTTESSPRSKTSLQNTSTVGATAKLRPPPKKDVNRKPDAQSVISRFGIVLGNLQSLFISTADSFKSNPMLLLRTFLFVLAFALAFSRREVRDRLRRIAQSSWAKLTGTIGMGMKVSSV